MCDTSVDIDILDRLCRRFCCTCIRMKLSIRTIRTLCPLQTLVMLRHFWIQFVARCAIASSHMYCLMILSSSIDRLVSTCGQLGHLASPNFIGCFPLFGAHCFILSQNGNIWISSTWFSWFIHHIVFNVFVIF